MCCCGQPIINGQPGYKWQPNDRPSIRPVYPPALEEGETLLYDEPGRCGGIDAHCHHYRVVKSYSSIYLLAQHGGGRESIRLSTTKHFLDMLEKLDTHSRYWLLHTVAYAHRAGRDSGMEQIEGKWRRAAAEKRIKTRKLRGGDGVKVWIDHPKFEVPA